MRREPDNQEMRGFALIAVMVALAILLALVTPFLVAMLNEANISSDVVAEEETGLSNEGHRDWLLHLASRTDLGNDAFGVLAGIVNALLDATTQGARFVMGNLVDIRQDSWGMVFSSTSTPQ